MPEHLCISVRFLDGAFHGRADQGAPEWPPSPLRLFQALVAAAAARWNERGDIRHAAPALQWFESLPPPIIVAPASARQAATGYRLYVPDNIGDLVGAAWSRGREASIADYRTEKLVRPTRFEPEGALCYLWPLDSLPAGFAEHRETLFTAVRSITHLGWGVDLVVAEGTVLPAPDALALPGLRWTPSGSGTGRSLRVPRPGALADLERRHRAFLNRLDGDAFSPVPPLAVFDLVGYASDAEPPARPHTVFALRRVDDSGYRPFDPVRRGLHIAGMLRHAAAQPALARSLGWSPEESRQFVLGHGEKQGADHEPVSGARLAFLPLPSIEWRGEDQDFVVGSIRRVLATTFGAGAPANFPQFAQRLGTQELIDEKTGAPTALLAAQPESDSVVRRYLQPATTWATVTPVILPGYDDPRKLRQRLAPENAAALTPEAKSDVLRKLDRRIDFLLRKALRQAGFSESLATHAQLEWRSTGFWPGTALASAYAVPSQHRRYRRVHVRLSWRTPAGEPLEVPGPLCIGGGKFSGMGLFAAVSAAAQR